MAVSDVLWDRLTDALTPSHFRSFAANFRQDFLYTPGSKSARSRRNAPKDPFGDKLGQLTGLSTLQRGGDDGRTDTQNGPQ